MTFDIFADLFVNIVLLVSLSVVYSLFGTNDNMSDLLKKIYMGILVSFVGVIVMSNHVEIEPGIYFDGRSMLMVLSGFYFGFIPSAIGAVALSIYRIIQGGSGVIPGISWILIPSLIGLVWRYLRITTNKKTFVAPSYLEQYSIFFITQAFVIGILYFFPNRVPLYVIETIALPTIIAYPIGGFVVSLFMLRMRNNYFRSVMVEQREREYNDLFNGGSNFNFIIDRETNKFVNVNQVAIDKYGYTKEEFLNLRVEDIDLFGIDSKIQIEQHDVFAQDYISTKHILRSGKIIDVEIRSNPILLDNKTFTYAVATDITKRLENEKKYQDVNNKLRATLLNVKDGIIVTDKFGLIEVINDVALEYLDNKEHYKGMHLSKALRLFSDYKSVDFEEMVNATLLNSKSFASREPYYVLNHHNEKLYVDFSLSSITYENEKISKGCILVIQDVTNRHMEKNKIEYVSQHDYLTGLYNRYFLETEITRLDTKRQLPITLIIGDVNGLKLVNDTFGHIEGDKYLKEISNIIKQSTRSEDIIARWGGDEFMILLPQTTEANAKKVTDRIADLSKKSRFDLFTPSISLGISTKTDESMDINQVLTDAENIMYANKINDGKLMRKDLLKNVEKMFSDIHQDLGNHSIRVAKEITKFTKFLRLTEEDTSTIVNYAKYHNIGWITVDSSTVDKTIPLRNQKLDISDTHSEIGYRIMKSIPELSKLASLIEAHNENFDGTGFPNKLKGREIPYFTRILAVVDEYDVLNLHAKSLDDVIQSLRDAANKKLDPDLVEKYIAMLQKQDK